MLSYRHEYHAGNVGDLLKHSVLTLVIEYLKQKPAPIRYIDTHAGAGRYSTRSPKAEQTGEYNVAIGAIDRDKFPVQLRAYESVLSPFTMQHQYPGSPLIAAKLLRAQDELRLYELHSTDFPVLEELFARDRRAQVAQSDGYASVKALLPVQNSRALVLIDPSYETQADYAAVTQCVEEGYSRMPNAVFIIWYPVVGNPALDVMLKKLTRIVQNKLWCFELSATNAGATGMTANGVLVINPPWTLAPDLQAAFQSICPRLPFGQCDFTASCLKQ